MSLLSSEFWLETMGRPRPVFSLHNNEVVEDPDPPEVMFCIRGNVDVAISMQHEDLKALRDLLTSVLEEAEANNPESLLCPRCNNSLGELRRHGDHEHCGAFPYFEEERRSLAK